MTAHLPIERNALNQLFSEARTHSVWQDKPVSDELLKHVYDLCKMGATSANCQPLRIVFVKTAVEKEKLLSCLYEGNIEKTKTAPVTALFAYDMKFFDHLPDLFPHVDARPWFTQNETDTYTHSFRNANLQAAYFMLAARALGLDCGPMSGFIEDKMNAEFFAGTSFRVSFICNLGYGDAEAVYERLPRLDFDVACKII